MSISEQDSTAIFQSARNVAACPHVLTCKLEFAEKYDEAHFAAVPSPDYVGPRYRGLVIIGGNPGVANTGTHNLNDAKMFALQEEIAKGNRQAYDELMRFLPTSMASWAQMVDNDGRRRMDYEIEEVAYINIVKCGTRPTGGDTAALFAGTSILRRCWVANTQSLLDILNPTHIVALWVPLKRVLRNLGFEFEGPFGHHSGARHLSKDARYAAAKPVFDDFYKR